MISDTSGFLFGLRFQEEDINEVESHLNNRYGSSKGSFICDSIREL